jgi:hypothetical protein
MKRFFRLLPCIIVNLACLCGIAVCSDGIVPETPFKLPFTVDGKETIHRAQVVVDGDGVARLFIDYVKGNDILTLKYIMTRQDGPDPQPDPDPDPDPNPVPPPGEWTAVIVEETADRTPDQALVINSKPLREMVKTFRVVDPLDNGKQAAVGLDVKDYVDRAMNYRDQWPLFFLTAPDGTVVFEGALPKTVDDAKSLISKHVGKGGKK